MSSDPPTPDEPSPRPPREPPTKRSDREMIEAALEQATPRQETVSFGDQQPLSDTFPGYEVLREIHRGGQGVVYQALQKTTRRKVAIKVIHGGPFSGSSGRARFEREVQVLGQLNHPNIVRIHDSGVTLDGSFYYVMDYISGRSLDEILREPDRPPIDDILRLFTKICDAVNAAHLKGVIHRDIKPANVRIDVSNEPIVVDFGLAKIAGPDVAEDENHTPRLMTVTGQFIGSLPWASPEQAEGRPSGIDVRTDVYSLGVVLYQMLTGKFPYPVVGIMRDVLDNILKAEPARPSTVRRQINNEVETIVLKCLSKDRDRRYQNAGELARDIRHYLAGEPIEAKRDSGLYVVTKTLQRYRVAAGVAAAFLLLLAAFALVMTLMFADQVRLRRLASESEHQALQLAQEARLQQEKAQSASDGLLSLIRIISTDVDARLREISGTSAARAIALDAAIEQTDHYRTLAGEPAQRDRAIAQAYSAAGRLRGTVYGGRIGQSAKMKELFDRSAAIRSANVAANPNEWWAHFDQGLSQLDTATVLDIDKNSDASFESLGLAAESFRKADDLASFKLGSTSPEATGCKDWRARAQDRRGDLRFAQAQAALRDKRIDDARTLIDQASTEYAAARQWWSDRSQRDADDEIPLEQLADANDRAARLLTLSAQCFSAVGDNAKGDAEASASYQQALDTIAQTQPLFAHATEAFHRLMNKRPDRSMLAAELAQVHHNAGESLMVSANTLDRWAKLSSGAARAPLARAAHESALAEFQKALPMLRELCAADPASLQAKRDLAIICNKVGRELRDLGRLSDARQLFDESFSLRRAVVSADNTVRHNRDLAVAYEKLGLLHARLAADDSRPPAERERSCRDAIQALSDGISSMQQAVAAHVGTADSYAVETRSLLWNLTDARLRLANLLADSNPPAALQICLEALSAVKLEKPRDSADAKLLNQIELLSHNLETNKR